MVQQYDVDPEYLSNVRMITTVNGAWVSLKDHLAALAQRNEDLAEMVEKAWWPPKREELLNRIRDFGRTT